jgi:uncharacterized membrane protein HdeD (DUF308 family)
MEFKMLAQMFRNWWMFVVRGVLAVVFGALALIWPGQTLQILVLVFGAFVLMDGAFAVATGIASAAFFDRWWVLLLEGLTGIVIGMLTFFWPAITALALVYFVAAWAIITGVLEIVAAIQYRHVISGEWAMILNGLLSVAFGILVMVFPGSGAVGLAWMIGIYAIAAGITEMIFGFRVRRLWSELKKIGAPGK